MPTSTRSRSCSLERRHVTPHRVMTRFCARTRRGRERGRDEGGQVSPGRSAATQPAMDPCTALCLPRGCTGHATGVRHANRSTTRRALPATSTMEVA